ncbi:MAG TPA: hypothetical protein VER96_28985 [Polyangiaceae bacterium]|nr:hypothetical protein [Polyangiaceae bacterium]
MFGFSKRRSLEEIAGDDFVLGAGVWALRGKGPLRVVASENGYDLQVGPAPLEMLNGAAWPGGPFEMSAGFAGDAQFARHSCAAQPGPFGILELPGEVWFGLELELAEHQVEPGPCLLRTQTISLGITRDKRLRRALEQANWIRGTRARVSSSSDWVDAPDVVHERELPTKHTAVSIAPELYGVLRDPEDGGLRFQFDRAEYDDLLQSWSTAPITVRDQDSSPSVASPALRDLSGPVLAHASLLLLPWLAPALGQRCLGVPIFQMFETGPIWIDSDEPTWQETLAEEVARRGASPSGQACGPPLVFRDGKWLNAVTALKVS